MKNLGIASVKVEYSSDLVNIDADNEKSDYDCSAHQWADIQHCPNLAPIFCEQIESADGAFAAIYPAKRKYYINNYVAGGTSPSPPTTEHGITWTPINSTAAGSQADIKAGGSAGATSATNFVPAADFKMPGDYGSVANYQGPIWVDDVIPAEAQSDDGALLKVWTSYVAGLGASVSGLGSPITGLGPGGLPSPGGTPATTTTTTTLLPKCHYVNQTQVRSGLIWGIESSDFLTENMPFWVNIKRTQTPPDPSIESFIIIQIGVSDADNFYELYIANNKKATLYDNKATGTDKPAQIDFPLDLARVLGEQRELEIGIMTVAGKMVVWVNKTPLVYNRIELRSSMTSTIGQIREAKIPAGKLRIIGSNVQAAINVSAMTFAQLGIFGVLVPSYTDAEDGTTSVDYHGMEDDGTITGSVCKLPTDPGTSPGGTSTIYGVDCNEFFDPGSTSAVNPSGFGFHQDGKIWLEDGGSVGSTSGLPNVNGFVLIMQPDDTTFGSYTIPYGGCPYFFRIKGAYEEAPDPTSGFTELHDVLSVSETASAPDYFHVKKSATITVYNKGGTYDFFRDAMYCVRISWKWDDGGGASFTTTFTGLTISASSSESPGKETMTLQCEDYMYVLNNMPIINSPFYDGMIFHWAIADLAKRAGISTIVNDWEDPLGDFYLPSGYAFTKPSMRFPNTNMLLECMINIIQRCEGFLYFDGNGDFHVKELPGGLLADTASAGTSVKDFVRDPTAVDVTNIILDEKTFECNFDSTVNKISIMSLDRDSRNPILYSNTASPSLVKFKKVLLIDQPAYGDYATVVDIAARTGNRVFKRIKKSAFKTVGGDTSVIPLDFVTIDADQYRVMALTRTYGAEDNNLLTEYNCEFVGS